MQLSKIVHHKYINQGIEHSLRKGGESYKGI